jgi:hypothetical protein
MEIGNITSSVDGEWRSGYIAALTGENGRWLSKSI